MEIIEKYIKFVKKWEGGLSRDKNDSASSFPCPTPYNGKSGWHTNAGITYAAWVQFYGNDKDADFYRMPADMWFKIFKKGYWDKVKGDAYNSQNIAATSVYQTTWPSKRSGKGGSRTAQPYLL